MSRVIWLAFLISLLVTCWLWMQIVHELGHMVGALVTGATVERVVLHPLTISRTEVSGGTSPLVVIWLGPLLGCLLPLGAWLIAEGAKWRMAFLLRFFAGFCLVVNGAYLAGGSFDGIGDCGDLLRHGTPIWLLWLFGAIALPAGLALWHRQGRDFGFGAEVRSIEPRAAFVMLAIVVATIVVELVCS